jgi:hypothetical protein
MLSEIPGEAGERLPPADIARTTGSVMPVGVGLSGLCSSELGRFRFQRGDFLLKLAHFAGLVILPLGARQLLPQHLKLLLDDFQSFFCFAVHVVLSVSEAPAALQILQNLGRLAAREAKTIEQEQQRPLRIGAVQLAA